MKTDSPYLVIDSGTTQSRIRLVRSGQATASASRQIGARDVAITGSNHVLKQAIRECIEELLSKNFLRMEQIEAIIASGMITSNMGLLEIPHLAAPVALADLAAHLVVKRFDDIADKPIVFIPGVKTGFVENGNLAAKDMMRGEEAEIIGCLEHSRGDLAAGEMLFMHYGSHHKCILVCNGFIRECMTSMTGELMMAIAQQTILKNSLMPIEEMKIDMDWVFQGLQAAESSGVGRSLFSTRILDVMEKRTKNENSNFFLGILLSMDFAMVKQVITPEMECIVLYGKPLFPAIFLPVLQDRYPHLRIQVISESDSDLVSARGAIEIYRNSSWVK